MSLSRLWLSLAHGAHSQCGLSNGDVTGANGPVPVDTNEPGCNYVDTHTTIHNKFTVQYI